MKNEELDLGSISATDVTSKSAGVSYCTFFDSGYFAKGTALIESIRSNGDTNEILVLCLDDFTLTYLESRASELNLRLVTLKDLMEEYPELEIAKNNRTKIEFLFTITPFVVKFALVGKLENHMMIYLDADLYFFGDPHVVIREIGNSSISIIKHNYPWFLRRLEGKYGTYNVGLLAFRNDDEGTKVVDWWASSCVEWCFDYPKDGKYADQGYLNSFHKISRSVKVLTHPGFNVAPWNSASGTISVENDSINVKGAELVFFHFHGLRLNGKLWVSSQLNYYSPMRSAIFGRIYGEYVRHILAIENRIGLRPGPIAPIQRNGAGLRGNLANLSRDIFTKLNIMFGQVIEDNMIQR